MKSFLLSIVISLFIFMPFVVSAQSPLSPGYLIVCGQENEEGEVDNKCDFEDLITLVQRVINVVIYLAVLVTPVLVSYAGFLLITGGDSEEKRTRAKGIFRTTIIGFIIILAAWLVVSAIIAGLRAEGSFLEGVQPFNF